jgi:quercetin dioxygenase-like cupin family protein
MFNITRIYSDETGESHFEDIEMALTDAGEIGKLSPPVAVNSLIFREVAPTYDWDFHNAPQRQYIILLEGEIEIETSLGEKRLFKAGDVLLAEDITGKGHKTKNLKSSPRKSLFITI